MPSPDPSSRAAARARWRGHPLSAVLFDLDGTLLDTAADIALALNRAIAEHGWDPLPVEAVQRLVGRGAPALIERAATAQGRRLDAALHAAVLDRFLHHYGALHEGGECAATPYDGVAEALQRLHDAGLRTAVVTNKPQRFAAVLLQRLALDRWVDLVVGGDTCERRKPDPQPLLHACAVLHVAPAQALMVGDSVNDVQAARAAGMPVVCVPYGYNEGHDPRALPCDGFVETLATLPALLGAGARPGPD